MCSSSSRCWSVNRLSAPAGWPGISRKAALRGLRHRHQRPGRDTRVSRHLRMRGEGGYWNRNYTNPAPPHIPGLASGPNSRLPRPRATLSRRCRRCRPRSPAATRATQLVPDAVRAPAAHVGRGGGRCSGRGPVSTGRPTGRGPSRAHRDPATALPIPGVLPPALGVWVSLPGGGGAVGRPAPPAVITRWTPFGWASAPAGPHVSRLSLPRRPSAPVIDRAVFLERPFVRVPVGRRGLRGPGRSPGRVPSPGATVHPFTAGRRGPIVRTVYRPAVPGSRKRNSVPRKPRRKPIRDPRGNRYSERFPRRASSRGRPETPFPPADFPPEPLKPARA